jgi:hypothetical protein
VLQKDQYESTDTKAAQNVDEIDPIIQLFNILKAVVLDRSASQTFAALKNTRGNANLLDFV